MKKVLSLVLAAMLALALLAGCSGGSDASQPGSTSQSGGGSSAAGGADGDGPADRFENKELNIAIFEGGFGPEYWHEMVAMFEAAYPGVKVTMQISPTIGDIIRPQIVAGQVPDFLAISDIDVSGVVASLIKDKGLLDITDVFEGTALGSDEILGEKIIEGLLDSNKCAPYGDGRIYLAPFNSGPTGMVYNKTLFEQNNWEVPVTWDDFFALGDVANEMGMSLFTYQGIYPNYLENILYPAIASTVGIEGLRKITSYQEGSVNNPEVLAVLENFSKIASGGYLLPGSVALNHTQSQTEQMNDRALFIPCGIWMEGEMAEAPRTEGYTFGMAPVPVINEGDTRYLFSNVEQFSIPAAAKNPELAKEFLRFLYSDESVKLFAEKSNGVYAIKGATELVKGIVTDGVYSMLKAYEDEDAVALISSFDAIPKGSKIVIMDEICDPIADVMNGAMTAEQWAQHIEDAFAQVRADIAAAE